MLERVAPVLNIRPTKNIGQTWVLNALTLSDQQSCTTMLERVTYLKPGQHAPTLLYICSSDNVGAFSTHVFRDLWLEECLISS